MTQMARALRISLANKCQILFGGAVLLIITAALSITWVRMNQLVESSVVGNARQLADAVISGQLDIGRLGEPDPATVPERDEMIPRLLAAGQWQNYAEQDPFLARAVEQFQQFEDQKELFREAHSEDVRYYRYARAIRKSEAGMLGDLRLSPAIETPGLADPLEYILVIQLRADAAERELLINRIYIVAAGLLAGLLAIGTFWFITTRLILSPVRLLRDTAEKVSEGDLQIRADIDTGDEFEQLSDVFNTMLENLRRNQDELRHANKTLDLKLGELAETNVALYEANKIKGEFLANVSHELRTPLNSIIGFAEVLEGTFPAGDGAVDEKRRRYIRNIISSSRHLLELINDLLDLAKIEAGRMELHIAPTSIHDTCEGLINLMRPQAEQRGIELRLDLQRNLPLIHTDAGRLQQILFNFLSNAIKFTPENGSITVSATLVEDAAADGRPRVRISVSDTGPGIALEDQDRIFDKFTQLDPSATRTHGGTGLGLTISRDLVKLLQGEISLESEVGRGTTFHLLLPLEMTQRNQALMPQLGDGIGGYEGPRPDSAAIATNPSRGGSNRGHS